MPTHTNYQCYIWLKHYHMMGVRSLIGEMEVWDATDRMDHTPKIFTTTRGKAPVVRISYQLQITPSKLLCNCKVYVEAAQVPNAATHQMHCRFFEIK